MPFLDELFVLLDVVDQNTTALESWLIMNDVIGRVDFPEIKGGNRIDELIAFDDPLLALGPSQEGPDLLP